MAGCLLVAGGLAAESRRSVRAGAVCLLLALVLSAAGWLLRRHGWWE
jgi:hypothetical protein